MGLRAGATTGATLADRSDVVTAMAESVDAALSGGFAVRLVAIGAGVTLWAATVPVSLVVTAAVVIPACVLWRWCSPQTFARCCGHRLRASILRIIHYGPRWPGWARAARLVTHASGTTVPVVPRLHRVICTAEADDLRVGVLPGRTTGDYEAVAAVLRGTRTCEDACVHALPDGQVAVHVPRHRQPSRGCGSTRRTRASGRTVVCRRQRAPRPAVRSLRSRPCVGQGTKPDRRGEDERDDFHRARPPVYGAGNRCDRRQGEGMSPTDHTITTTTVLDVLGIAAAPVLVQLLYRCHDITLGWPGMVAVVLVTEAASMTVCVRWAGDPALSAWWWLALTSLPLIVIDCARHRLPHRWVLAMAIGGLGVFIVACAESGHWWPLGRAIAAGLVALAGGIVLRVVAAGHLGGGDVTLTAALAVFLGWQRWQAVLFGVLAGALLLGLHAGWVWLATGRRSRRIAAGPSLIAGTWISLVVFSPA